MDMPSRLIAPFPKGQQVGTLARALGRQAAGRTPADRARPMRPAGGFLERLSDGILLWFKGDK